jgi:uncharacterized protein YdhG (YjbR/CyaY superfamily)
VARSFILGSMANPKTHDDYIAAAPEQFRPALLRLRSAVRTAMPDAEEVIAHNMPGFKVGGSLAVGYAAFSKQCGFYLPAAAISACAADLTAAGIKSSKTGVTFSMAKPIPDALLKRLVEATRNSIDT